ncbi:MAG: ACP synthase, partial [Planctomycetaceae bacterium]|nr:ACP synthase [Planctomycetaceae bacterium]
WSRGIKWTDMEVSNLMGGKPELRIHGVASDIAEEMGIQEMQISISHCQSYAVAYVIAIGD